MQKLASLAILGSLAVVFSSCITKPRNDASAVNLPAHSKRDSNHDGLLSHQEILEHSHKEVFANHDTDKNGGLSKSEWDAIPHSVSNPDAHFNQVDQNDDGEINMNEAIKFVANHVHYSKTFGVVDENDNDYLEVKEMYAKDPDILSITILSLPL